MKRHELEHLIRAAGAITGADEIIVIGSHGEFIVEMLRHGMLDVQIVSQRIATLPLTEADQTIARERWDRLTLAAARGAS